MERRAGTAIHPANAQGKFYRIVFEEFYRQGAGRIYRYWYDDRIVAMDLCIEGNGSIVILKTAYDENIAQHHLTCLIDAAGDFQTVIR